jgi:hypothetical protein
VYSFNKPSGVKHGIFTAGHHGPTALSSHASSGQSEKLGASAKKPGAGQSSGNDHVAEHWHGPVGSGGGDGGAGGAGGGDGGGGGAQE